MSKIEMMEVNQHTSDEVAKVLADLEAQGVDIAALQTALTAQGTNINTILSKVQNSGGGLTSCIRKIQRGVISEAGKSYKRTITLSGFSNLDKMFAIVNGYLEAAEFRPYFVDSLTTTSLTVSPGYTSASSLNFKVSYQVIEFY